MSQAFAAPRKGGQAGGVWFWGVANASTGRLQGSKKPRYFSRLREYLPHPGAV